MKNVLFVTIKKVMCAFILCACFSFVHVSALAEEEIALSGQEAVAFNSAIKEYKNKNYSKTLTILAEYVNSAEKKHPYIYLIYALSSYELKQYNKSIATYEKGVKHHPSNYNLLYNYAVTLSNANKNRQAGDIFLRVLRLAPAEQKRNIRFSAAQCYFQAGSYKKSAEVGKVLLEDGGKREKRHIELVAAAYYENNSFREAEKYYEMLTRNYYKDYNAWNGLASVRMSSNNNADAVSALEFLSRLYPKHKNIQSINNNISLLYADLRAPRLLLNKIKSLPMNENRKRMYVEALLNTSNKQDFFRFINEDIQKNPSAQLYFMKGEHEYRLQMTDDAIKSLELGSKFSGEYAEQCTLLLGMMYWENSQYSQAVIEYKKLLGSAKNSAFASIAIDSLEILEKESLIVNTITEEDVVTQE